MDETWVELRVHGVSGTPPESLLATPLLSTPHVEQVAGDDYSSFFRPVTQPADHVLEGYHWGRFTSGSWRQGLSLLLVPFGMINATQFMLLRPESWVGKWLHSIAGACLRVLALLLTALFSFAVGLILIDLIGWRWVGTTRMKTYAEGKVFVACIVLSALAVLGLAFLGWAGKTRMPPGSTLVEEGTGSDLSKQSDEADRESALFTANPNAWALRGFHVSAGLGTVALLADLSHSPTTMLDEHRGQPFVTIVGYLALILVSVVLFGDPDNSASLDWIGSRSGLKKVRRYVARVLAALLAGFGVGLVIVECVRTWGLDLTRPLELENTSGLQGFDGVATGLMFGGVLALLVLYLVVVSHQWSGDGFKWTRRDAMSRLLEVVPLAVAAAVARDQASGTVATIATVVLVASVGLEVWCAVRIIWPSPAGDPDAVSFRPYASGMTPFLLAALAVFIGVGFTAAAATAVSATLDLDVGKGVETGTTPMLDRVAYAWGLTVLEIAVMLLVLGLFLLFFYSRFGYWVDTMYVAPPEVPTGLPDGWRGRVTRAAFVARLKTWLPAIVIVFALVGMVMSAVQAYEMYGCDDGRCRVVAGLLGFSSEPRETAWSTLAINGGAYFFVAAVGLLVTISRGALKDTGKRRGINVVWDIFSFWPHATHPFAPRPYSRWTVIELRNRIRFHLGGRAGEPAAELPPPGVRVVVAAHSQGSVIAFGALMLLTPDERERVAFLTCGSQLRVIYPRAFPAYFNFEAVTWLFGALGGGWVNLYRATDPLAGPVLSWSHRSLDSRHFPAPPPDGSQQPDQFLVARRTRRSGRDWRLVDPVPYDVNCEQGAVSAIHGHHDYWLDPGWDEALKFLRGEPTE